jgi:23S rRNA pseudouridine1911/1915/1917 synthase
MHTLQLHFIVDAPRARRRLDQVLAEAQPDYSRARWQQWIKNGDVRVNEKIVRANHKLRLGETIVVDARWAEETLADLPQNIQLDIVYEDEDILILNKPIGMVAHPAVGNRSGTLLNALLHHAPTLSTLPRAGLLHRLDKDTSGLLMVAKNLKSYTNLSKKLQARDITRHYYALVQGKLTAGGTIDADIGRHPLHRTKMAVVVTQGKKAITHYRVVERFEHYTLIEVQLETGRTHQIRVHLAHRKHALVGDPTYGGRLQFPRGASEDLKNFLRQFKHQALHAYKLGLVHPRTGKYLEWTAPLPSDFEELLTLLRKESKKLS